MHRLNDYQLEQHVNNFCKTAKALPDVTFYLTKVGCGIAGYDEEYMKSLFADMPENVIKPEGW